MSPSTKVTFSLDDETVGYLARIADRLGVPKSQVVREAIRVYGDQSSRLSEQDRDRLLARFDQVTEGIPSRPRGEVEAEIDELARARRRGGRATGSADEPTPSERRPEQ